MHCNLGQLALGENMHSCQNNIMLPAYVQKSQFKSPSPAERKLLHVDEFYLLVLEGLTTQCELYLVHQTEDLSLLTEGILRSERVLGKD